MEKRSVKINRPVNRWKWAFTVLLAVIVLATGIVINRVTAPAPTPAVTRKADLGDT